MSELQVHLTDVTLATTTADVGRGRVRVERATCIIPRATLERAVAHWGAAQHLAIESLGEQAGQLVLTGHHRLAFRAVLALGRSPDGQLRVQLVDASPSSRLARAGQAAARTALRALGGDLDEALCGLLRDHVVPDLPGFSPGRGRTVLEVDVAQCVAELAGFHVPPVRCVSVSADEIRLELGD